VASAFGVSLGFAAMYAAIFLAKALVPGLNEDQVFGWAMFPVIGASLSACQAIVLHGRIPRAWRWVVATLAGFAAGIAASAAGVRAAAAMLGREPDAGVSAPLILTLIGACLGLAQWAVLRRRMRRPAWWIPASALGWLCLSLVIGKSISSPLDMAAVGAVPAVFTGVLLARNLGQRQAGAA
jgi:hypothetical protein